MRGLWDRVGLNASEQLREEVEEEVEEESRETPENFNVSETPEDSPLLGELGIEPTGESHIVVPAAQERLPLGEPGIEPTPESSGPGAQGTPLLQSSEESPPDVQPDGSLLTPEKEEEESISVEEDILSNSQDENILANIGSSDRIAQ